MSPASLFETCGYLASFLGTFLEGEIMLLTTVLSSQLGHINFFGGMGLAFFGAFTGDFLKFYIAKKRGKKILDNKQILKVKVDKASVWFDKHPFIILCLYKFMYGFTTIIIVMAGLKDISFKQFALHSAVSIGLWVTVFGGFGYFCADVMIERIDFLSSHSKEVTGVLVLIGLGYWFFVKRKHTRNCLGINDDLTIDHAK